MKRILLFAIFFITQLGYGQITGDYRSTGNVTFAATINWQIYNGTAWVSATMAPKDASYTTANTITVLSGHNLAVSTTVTIAAQFSVLGTFTLNSGASLSIGPMVVNYNGPGNAVSVGANSALVVNGNLTITKGDMAVAGTIYIDGNFSTSTGNVSVSGGGSMNSTGSMTTQGSGEIFDSRNDCYTGPCSGTSLNCPSTISPTSQPICQNSQSSTITFAGGSGATVVKWQSTTDFINFTDIANTATTLPPQTVTQTTRFRAVYTVSSGCTGNLNSPYSTVFVNPSVPASVSIAASPSSTVCTGTNVTFTATPTNEGTSPTYQWTKNGINISGATSVTYTGVSGTNFISNDIIRCVMTSNASPCLTGSPATSSGLNMTVNANNTIAAGVNRITCINSAITSITLATTGATGATFSGLPTGVTGSWAADVVTISGTPTASGIFNYTVTTTGGCPPATTTGTITVNPLPSAPSVTKVDASCTVSTGSITITAPTGMNYSINGTDYTNTDGIFTSVAAGTYQVTFRNAAGCISSATPVIINPSQ